MNYPDSVRFLYALGNEVKTAKLGLERIGALLEALGNPQQACRIVHVAGTNGKGSTCAMIESGLRAAGYRTGLFTSPHLVEPTERIQVAGNPVSAGGFASAFDQVHACAEMLLRRERIDLHPTYFESVTAMALLLFRECGVEFAVFEVGLGGRLDATNVVTPELCVITPVDFDHEAYLGKSLESIAGEKAGILKLGVPAVFARQRAEAAGVLDARAAALGVTVTHSSEVAISSVVLGERGSDFMWGEVPVSCPLPGEHQVENARTAIAALQCLGAAPEAIRRGILQTAWPGRLERVAVNPEIVLDGAHNPAGARALAKYLDRFYEPRRVWLIYGAMRDKSVEEMTGILFPRAGHVIVTAPAQSRALRPEAIREMADHNDIQVAPDIQAALALAQAASSEDAIFVSGSLFLVGEARALLCTRAHSPTDRHAGETHNPPPMLLSRLRAYFLIDPLLIVATVVLGFASLLASAFDKSGHTQHAIARFWARTLLAIGGARVRVEGLEKLERNATYVLVANHTSYMDTPAVLLIPLQIRFFAKQGLFSIPLLGGHLRRAGHFPVSRENPRASLKRLTEAALLVRERGVSVVLFPEGGRSSDGLGEFKEGAAYLAIKAGVPAVPVGIVGTGEMLPMGSMHVRPHPVTIRIGDPIATGGMKLASRHELNHLLRCKVAELIGELKLP